MAEVGAEAIVAGDFNWVGMQSNQAAIQDSTRHYDEKNEERERYTTAWGEEIWENWPGALKPLGPRHHDHVGGRVGSRDATTS